MNCPVWVTIGGTSATTPPQSSSTGQRDHRHGQAVRQRPTAQPDHRRVEADRQEERDHHQDQDAAGVAQIPR